MRTARRRRRGLLRASLEPIDEIGFLDVGSGGPLKAPWKRLPEEKLRLLAIDPELERDGVRPLCISNREGEAEFHLAVNPRASSLHRPSERFIRKFARDELRIEKTISVRLSTVDREIGDAFDRVDLMDVNVEGHDHQVLEGASRVLGEGFVKALRVEFELAPAWIGQGYFADIDTLLRGHGFELGDIAINQQIPSGFEGSDVRGEPLWGKAVYFAGPERWARRAEAGESGVRDLQIGVAAALLFDQPWRALELLEALPRSARPDALADPEPALRNAYLPLPEERRRTALAARVETLAQRLLR